MVIAEVLVSAVVLRRRARLGAGAVLLGASELARETVLTCGIELAGG